MMYRETYNKLVEAQARGDGPINAMCVCHALQQMADARDGIRPGDVFVVVHPNKCEVNEDHEGNTSVCVCNDNDNKDTSRIE